MTRLARELERPEVAGWADLYRAAPPDLRARQGMRCAIVAGAACGAVDALPGARLLNHAFGLGLRAGVAEADLERVTAFYGDTPHVVGVTASAPAGRLDARLRTRGYAPTRGWIKFRREARRATPVPAGPEVQAASAATAAAFGEVVARGFDLPEAMAPWFSALVGRPGWLCFLALEERRPIGAGAVYVHGDVGWITLGATHPEHRRQGAQAALLAARIDAARAAGCRVLVTETGAPDEAGPGPSHRNMLRAGFSPVYVRANLASAGAGAEGAGPRG